MADHRILVIADDLTGALEVGGKFAATGVRSQVRTPSSLWAEDLRVAAGAFVVDTETRHARVTEAARRVSDLARAACEAGFSHVYKKTDSTLRGNIGAELAALIEAWGGAPLFYVPAYPQMGRTVKGGTLYVNGVTVSATHVSSDPFNPVTESHIPTILCSQCRQPIRSVPVTDIGPAAPGVITLCDGETDDDVEVAARVYTSSSDFRLSAGPAGFAASLARLLDLPRAHPPALPRIKTALVVNGSLHPVSHQQVEQAKQVGFKSIESDSLPSDLDDRSWIVLEKAGGSGEATLDFAQGLAKSAIRLLGQFAFDALIIFGGDTAYAIVDALGNPPLHVVSEVMEGVPVCRIEPERLSSHAGHRHQDLYLVTKAGSFGPPDVLSALRELLS